MQNKMCVDMDWRDSGQRIRTLVVFLCDVLSGGDLIFPRLHIRFRPRIGTGISFDNCDGRGRPHPLSMHGSLPVIAGEKWAAVKFFYEHPVVKRHPELTPHIASPNDVTESLVRQRRVVHGVHRGDPRIAE
jgi:hypothetical protein